jgi:V8-like Glu-specific endopeptidase
MVMRMSDRKVIGEGELCTVLDVSRRVEDCTRPVACTGAVLGCEMPGSSTVKESRMKRSLLAFALLSTTALANEGMWMPQQLPQLAKELKEAGLELDPARLTQLTEFPLGAIISLGGCTASFVSDQGLVVTNHHCAYGSIQYQSTAEKNLIKNGFLAQSLAEELPAAPGSRVFVTVAADKVTDRMVDAKVAKLTGKARNDALEKNEKSIIAQCEQDAGYRCTVFGYYGGLEFYLVKQLEIRDVRLVHAPPEGVGKFGGDNWQWPRHTGDYSYFRAYVGKDGKPADFNADNVPYRPKHVLKLAAQGVKEGDFVMVTGYPGRTNRHRLPSEVAFTFEWNYPQAVKLGGEQLAVIGRETKDRKAAEIAYASTMAGINNGYKNRQGMLESYAGSELLSRRQRQHDELKAWVNADAKRQKRYGTDIANVEALITERNDLQKREFLLGPAAPRFLNVARTLYRLANEKAKRDDLAREPGFQQRDWPRIQQGLDAIDRRYDQQVDEALAATFLQQYLALPAREQNTVFLNTLGVRGDMDASAVKAQLDRFYGGSQLGDKTQRLAWMDRDVAAFKASDDAFIKAAVALYADDLQRENRDKNLAGNIQKAYANYMSALIDWKGSRGELVYPDANSTLRVSFGKVAGRVAGNADGTAWTAFTSLRGVAAKNTGSGEFDAPEAQIAAIKAKKFDRYYDAALDSVPVNYLATLDITGGNSGSPVLNSRGELVGLAFDGTLDSVISDWSFNPTTTRTIAVDARYMLWQMQVVDHADRLLNEMGVPKSVTTATR